MNKVETQVELRWCVSQSRALREVDKAWLCERLAHQLTASGEIIVTSCLTRSQLQNREDAAAKLAGLLRSALLRPKRRRATRPGRGAIERRLSEKRQQSDRKRSRKGYD